MILLPATGLAAGRVLAERIRSAVSAEVFELRDVSDAAADHGVDRRRGVPPGLDQDDLKVAGERLIAQADLALYEAKAGGRNSVVEAASS